MKTIFILYALVVGSFANAQENPWIPKGENPWKENPNKENMNVEKKDTLSNVVGIIDTESDSIQHIVVFADEGSTLQKQLLTEAGDEAFDSYNSAGDFGAGFAFGFFFNYVGFIPDAIYISVNSKREKETIKLIEEDSRYDSVNDEKLEKKVGSKIKSKKAIATLGGTLVGGAVQVGLALVILSSIW